VAYFAETCFGMSLTEISRVSSKRNEAAYYDTVIHDCLPFRQPAINRTLRLDARTSYDAAVPKPHQLPNNVRKLQD
jgi:hypothetical protein